MSYSMPNHNLRSKALRTIYGQSKKDPAPYEAQQRWMKASPWNVWAVFREYVRLERAAAV